MIIGIPGINGIIIPEKVNTICRAGIGCRIIVGTNIAIRTINTCALLVHGIECRHHKGCHIGQAVNIALVLGNGIEFRFQRSVLRNERHTGFLYDNAVIVDAIIGIDIGI